TSSSHAAVAASPSTTSPNTPSGMKPGAICRMRKAIRGGKPVISAIQYAQITMLNSVKLVTANQSMRLTMPRLSVGTPTAASSASGTVAGSSHSSAPFGASSARSASAAAASAGSATAGSPQRPRQRYTAQNATGHAGQ